VALAQKQADWRKVESLVQRTQLLKTRLVGRNTNQDDEGSCLPEFEVIPEEIERVIVVEVAVVVLAEGCLLTMALAAVLVGSYVLLAG
jgi:hypothetical protein